MSWSYRTIEGWLAINVLDPQYGAKGDGVTDDTGAVQAAVNAANLQYQNWGGQVDVVLPPGYAFRLGQITPAHGVRICAYGAVIIPILANIPLGVFYWPAGAGTLTRFGIAGGDWQGTGNEDNFQLIFYTGTGNGCAELTLRDMRVNNWGSGVYYVRNPVGRLIVDNNKLLTVGQRNTQGLNIINVVFDNVVAASGEMLITRNIVEGAGAPSINLVSPAGAQTLSVRALVVHNIVSGMPAGAPKQNMAGSIIIELDVASTFQDFTISDNDVVAYADGATRGAIGVGTSGTGTVTRGKICNNRITNSLGNGVYIGGVTGCEVDVTDNRINCSATPIGGIAPMLQTGNRFSAGKSQGRATLVAGTVTVNTAEIQANDNVQLNVVVPAGTRGEVQLGTIVAGTSFVINSIQPGTASTLQAADTSTVYWRIDH